MGDESVSKRVVVCGATGYLGRHLVKRAHARGLRVRALARSEARLGDVRPLCDEVFVGEATKPETLAGLCDGADYVVSSLGNRSVARKPDCFDVDYRGNMNIVSRAREAKVAQVVFVSILRGPELRASVPQFEARERVVDALRTGDLPWTVIRPSGFFNDMIELLDMARKGRAWILAGGTRFNPIHGADLAEVCLGALGDPGAHGREIPAGGPDVMTMREAAALAFEALGKPAAISEIPIWMLSAAGTMARPFNLNAASLMLMMAAFARADAPCDRYGTHHLADFFREIAAKGGTG